MINGCFLICWGKEGTSIEILPLRILLHASFSFKDDVLPKSMAAFENLGGLTYVVM